ncbi:tRNA dimethylallyltransferase [Clavibacter michiganensis]|uniref:tRNA (adenosine(37)-N6)-dimethylallyltransferase MiaA n=1 Tax=Clavibacter michiganensis TaxID=28447 RepID=UPI001AEA31B6|nr:tRNA (adenosine(37)-N6)-dimethylallyltransferase MiaA [Clavibacter michiganensis]MBP2458724.1 tRNA dimethylallyltransferase [Clavibacter michiganensis]MDQ0411296.1 tRNA dimethylallyltransferase [Clavibacter michiganensis]
MIPIVAVVGATGTGKSALSLDIADRLRAEGRAAEIVNADAMQLYRGMDIGTAKLPEAERRGVPHHMLDVLDVTAEATVAAYQEEARGVISGILERGAVPILVGGSGLYVSSVLFDYDFPGTDPEIRQRLEQELEATGPGMLHRRLRDLDPAAAQRIGAHNGRRLVRALEVVEITGPQPERASAEPQLWHPARILALTLPREELVPRLDARVSGMWEDGLVDEVAGLLPAGLADGVTASRAIGYAQAARQLAGELTEEQAVEETRALTRRYARRQVSWFGRYADAVRLDARDDRLLQRALDTLEAARP